MRTPTNITAIVLSFAVVACSNSTQEKPPHSFQVFNEAGITIAETTGGPKYEGELFEYTPVITLELGDAEDTLLYNPSRFIMDSEGWFYVYDYSNVDIVVFDPEGKFHHRFGREGEGPGEFRFVKTFFIMDELLHFFDKTQMRAMRFRRNGDLVDMMTVRASDRLIRNTTDMIHMPDREHLLLFTGSDMPLFNAERGGSSWCSAVRLTAAGDTVWSWSSEPVSDKYPGSIRRGNSGINLTMTYPYSPRPRAYFVPVHGIISMASYSPCLDIFNLDGQHHRSIRIDMGNLAVTDEDRQAVYDWYDRIIDDPDEVQDRRIAMAEYRNSIQFRETKAVPPNNPVCVEP